MDAMLLLRAASFTMEAEAFVKVVENHVEECSSVLREYRRRLYASMLALRAPHDLARRNAGNNRSVRSEDDCVVCERSKCVVWIQYVTFGWLSADMAILEAAARRFCCDLSGEYDCDVRAYDCAPNSVEGSDVRQNDVMIVFVAREHLVEERFRDSVNEALKGTGFQCCTVLCSVSVNGKGDDVILANYDPQCCSDFHYIHSASGCDMQVSYKPSSLVVEDPLCTAVNETRFEAIIDSGDITLGSCAGSAGGDAVHAFASRFQAMHCKKKGHRLIAVLSGPGIDDTVSMEGIAGAIQKNLPRKWQVKCKVVAIQDEHSFSFKKADVVIFLLRDVSYEDHCDGFEQFVELKKSTPDGQLRVPMLLQRAAPKTTNSKLERRLSAKSIVLKKTLGFRWEKSIVLTARESGSKGSYEVCGIGVVADML